MAMRLGTAAGTAPDPTPRRRADQNSKSSRRHPRALHQAGSREAWRRIALCRAAAFRASGAAALPRAGARARRLVAGCAGLSR